MTREKSVFTMFHYAVGALYQALIPYTLYPIPYTAYRIHLKKLDELTELIVISISMKIL